MKTILVPTDFSDYSLSALKVAASIAKKIQAKINLVHVNNLPSSGIEGNQYYNKFYKELITAADKQLNELIHLDFLKDIDVSKYILSNMLMWEIVNHQKFNDADLIVLGSHGTSGFNKFFIGSNTEKIIRIANSPVLTIKNEILDFKINKMVFASNFFKESYTVFEKIRFFADLYNARIELLKIITPKDFESTLQSQKLIKNFIEKFKLKNFSINIYNADNIEKGIIDFSDNINADIIAIETHGRTGFAHLINGSLTEDIVKHEVKPVLSVKIPVLSSSASKFMGFRSDYKNSGNG